ncbi:MAG: hypothetical protein ACLTSZ_19325 [Lachnospiraceae bacterium]
MQAHFVSANDDDTICYYAHCISRTGSYLSEGCGIKEGEAIAYLIAPPLEAMFGVDAALKAADVKCCVLVCSAFRRPTLVARLLTGSQSACKAACDAFAVSCRGRCRQSYRIKSEHKISSASNSRGRQEVRIYAGIGND